MCPSSLGVGFSSHRKTVSLVPRLTWTRNQQVTIEVANYLLILLTFYNCIVPAGFLSWEIWVAFPGESQLQQSRYPTQGACGVFQCFHNPLDSDMDFGILNVCTDVNACNRTRGCVDTLRESALKVDSGRKIPCCTGESNLCRWRAGPVLQPTELHPIPTQISDHKRR